MANIIEMLEKEEIARLGKTIPSFAPGDTVVVGVNVVEGTRKRVQAYEGVVIAIRNRGLNSSFIVRKISSGEGVEPLAREGGGVGRGECGAGRRRRRAAGPGGAAPASRLAANRGL